VGVYQRALLWLCDHYLQGGKYTCTNHWRYHWFNASCEADLKSLMAGLTVNDVVSLIEDALMLALDKKSE
jgi:hypothetical protein